MRGLVRRAAPAPGPEASAGAPAMRQPGILLASEGRPFCSHAVEQAAVLARRSGGPVHILVIARIWGTSLGFPNPGLNPSRQEWEQAREIVSRATAALEGEGVPARGGVVGTRNGAKLVMKEARRLGCTAIVMGADPERRRIVADFMWSQEPHRVARHARRADMPIHLVDPS